METYKITHIETESRTIYVQADSTDSALHLAGEIADRQGDIAEPDPQYTLMISVETVGEVKPLEHVYTNEDLQ